MPTLQRRLAGAMMWRYGLALALIASLSAGAFAILFITISAEEKQADLLRLVTMQQAESQRLAFFANAYAAATPADRAEYKRELRRSIETMERRQDLLVGGDGPSGFTLKDVERIRDLLFLGDNPFDDQVRRFLGHARAFYALPADAVRQDHIELLSLNLAGMNYIPQGYDLISDVLANERDSTIGWLKQFEVMLFGGMLALLVFEALFIFRPLMRKVVQSVEALERSREETRRLAEKAELASRTKSAFLASMSHELRTPLNAIIGFSETIERELLGPVGRPKYRDYAGHIRESGAYLLQLVNDLLDLSKAEAGRLNLEEGTLDPADTVQACLAMMAARADKGGVRLVAELPEGLAQLRADPLKVRQVLLNLLSNAVKFTPAGGEVTVRAVSGPAHGGAAALTLEVHDTGPGIPPDEIARVLEPYEVLQATVASNREGTGLGLAIASELMQLHGGRLELNSVLGQGTVARMHFPPDRLLPPAPAAAPEEAPPRWMVA
jgi:signal transduction histidine kinase